MNAIEELNKACSIAEKSAIGLMKSSIKEYTRQDGTVVQAHEDSRTKGKFQLHVQKDPTSKGKIFHYHDEKDVIAAAKEYMAAGHYAEIYGPNYRELKE